MWLFTKYGFFSVTQHAKRRDNIQVRARTNVDLQALKDAFPALDRSPIIETPAADYRWRLIVQRWKWEVVGAALVADIDYGNFKGKMATIPGQRDKLAMLHDIWDLHHRYQERKHRPDPHAGHPELFRPHGDHLFDEDQMTSAPDPFRHMHPDRDDEGEIVWQGEPEEDEHDPGWENSRDSADDPEYAEAASDDDPLDLPAFLRKPGKPAKAGKAPKGKKQPATPGKRGNGRQAGKPGRKGKEGA